MAETLSRVAIGYLQKQSGDSTASSPSFPWKNGDAVWINALGSNPCAAIWSSAIETRRLSSTEGSAATSRSDEVARIVAIPLEVQKRLIGVFVVGLAPAATSQSSLARLEVRASLAAAVLEAWNRDQESALQHRCTKEVAESAGMVTSLHLQGVAGVGPRSLFSMPRVTARESSADEGSRAETELKCILQWLDEGVILFDAQENVRTLNSRFLQVAGLDSSDAAKLPTLDDLISTLSPFVADPGSFAQRWRNLARGIDGGIREELEFLRPSARIVQRLSRPILGSSGQRLGRVEIYRDLTTRRGFQSKLLHTEKLAALGQVISGVAHELNNPLTSILGYSQRLLEKEHTAGEGPRSAPHLRGSGTGYRDPAPAALECARNQDGDAHRGHQPGGAASHRSTTGQLGPGTHSPRDGPRYQLAASSWRCWAVATGADDGAIFSIALRAAGSVSRTTHLLNVNRTPVLSKSWPGNVADPRLAASRTLHHGCRILVVEDEPTVARLIADVLEDEGFQVDVQLDGREALQQADRETYDLVICDMKMPGLDGQHFYQALTRPAVR